MDRQHDWPSAPLSALADGLPAGSGWWLQVSPAYLQLLRDRIVLTEADFADLDAREADALLASLNAHFAETGVQFFSPRPDRWYLRGDVPQDLQTVTRAQAIGRDVRQHAVTGADARQWLPRLTEIQMLLHEHPVNQALEARGLLPVNSVWPEGGGVLPAQAVANDVALWSGRPLLAGLASLAGVPCGASPANLEAWLASTPSSGSHLVEPNPASDLERDWFAPMLAALRDGRLQGAILHLLLPDGVRSFDIDRRRRWHFWRRPQVLEVAQVG